MDTAVALVQAYLNVNGYFTVVEYPVLEVDRHTTPRRITDLDVLAFRFPGAGHEVIGHQGPVPLARRQFAPDPSLRCPPEESDMIVGEVKEGPARFNPAMRDPAVLEVALARFGCCPLEHVPETVRRLLSKGSARMPGGHTIRMVAFGAGSEQMHESWLTVPMEHVIGFLRAHLRVHWDILRHAHIRDQGLDVLALLEKWSGSTQSSQK